MHRRTNYKHDRYAGRQTKINKNFNLFNDYGDGYGIISSSNANHNISVHMQKSFALEREVGGGRTDVRGTFAVCSVPDKLSQFDKKFPAL